MRRVITILMVLALCLSMAVTTFAHGDGFVSSPGEGGTPCDHSRTYRKGEKDPTCTTAGFTGKLICKDCGEVLDEGHKTPAAGHKYDENGVCAECGDKGGECKHKHTFLKGEKAPTCTTAGSTGKVVCKNCHKVLDKGHKIPALGHKFDENGVCTVCGAADVPKTADNSNVFLWTSLMAFAAVALVAVNGYRRKRA